MAVGKYSDTLRHRGFPAFLSTQFLGAFNDNVYRIAVSLLAVDAGIHAGRSGGSLSLVGAVYILPFFFFSGYAGYMADVLSKRTVLVGVKAFEVVFMVLALPALWSGRIDFMLAVLFLLALQSTFFSPSKYGILPEMLPDKDLSRANGLLEMSTFLAILAGTAIGSMLISLWKGSPERIVLVLIGIAVAGALLSLKIPRVPPSGARKSFRFNPWGEIGMGLQRLHHDRSLWLTVLGISYFWFFGALVQMDVILFGKEILKLDELWIGLLLTDLAVGIGLGSMAAGRLSGDKVELGIVPLGAVGVTLSALFFARSTGSYAQAVTGLLSLGFSAGLFIVPLNAWLQQRSGREEKGRLIATNNFVNTIGILMASAVFWLLRDVLDIPTNQILLILGAFTLAATAYILTLLPDFLIRFALWMLTHTIYRIRIVGQEHVPLQGPALLVSNHVSHVDALLIGACLQRFIRFLVYRPYYEIRSLHWLFSLMKAIPISAENPRQILASLQQARAELTQGHVVCIFPEGSITRTGNLLPFKRGLERIVEGLDVPVIPVHLDRVWGSIFSFKERRFFWKWPQKIPYPVTVSFGPALRSTASPWEIRQAVAELGSEAAQHRRLRRDTLHGRFVDAAKRHWFSLAMADSTGRELKYGQALVGSLLLARWLKNHCPGQSALGIMLPASVAGALVNIGALLAGKIPVNLNFTAGHETMGSAIQQCDIRTIVSSRLFLARAKIEETANMVFLEDITRGLSSTQKVLTGVLAFLLPSRLLVSIWGGGSARAFSLATAIFSSGSTGVPKGVMLSHHNVLSNVEAIAQIFALSSRDRMMGVLPFFHSFGFTGTLWLPLLGGHRVAYHANPTDAGAIGEMVAKHRATVLMSAPTFFQSYARRCTPEQFSSLRYAVVGAEKLREPVARAFKQKFGIELLEGYGCTELAPVVAVNIPDAVEGRERQIGFKPGTVGHPIPGVAVQVIDPDRGEPLPPGQEGLLLVKGPNCMMGYLGQPEKTAEVFRDGWYVTGDIASVDPDGFIRITDRLSRFSKIGGEMVPHVKVEEAVNQILQDHGCVVTSLPDEQKGERLAVLYAYKGVSPDQLWTRLNGVGLPKLWIPKRENLYLIDTIPLLGSGKVDLKKAKAIAMEMAQHAAGTP